MFDDNISNLHRSKDKFKNNVTDSFGQSIVEKCYEPMLNQFHMIKNFNEISQVEENGIKGLLTSLRLII